MRVGVTGNYASGKGTVCDMFSALGAVIIDTDVLARELTMPEMPALQKIISLFGKDFLSSDGRLDRRKLGAFVFKDTAKVSALNEILHPLILNETIKRSADKTVIYMINAPLLFEAGFNPFMDSIIVVSSSINLSIQRGSARDGLSDKEIKERLNHQNSLNEMIKHADYVIDNSGSIENTRIQAEAIWNNLIISSQKTRQ